MSEDFKAFPHAAITIKPLAWRPGLLSIQMATPFPGFTYVVGIQDSTGMWFWWREGRMFKLSPPYADPEAAKAGAQADYESRMWAELSISSPSSKAAHDVLAERARQISAERFTTAQDDRYTRGQLARAAAAYALTTLPANAFGDNEGDAMDLPYCIELSWPFAKHWLKADDARRSLVKAGALIIAEIERLDRAAIALTDRQLRDKIVAAGGGDDGSDPGGVAPGWPDAEGGAT
jgi:hypothetical protein